MAPTELTLEILAQPTDETCGPTCLHAVYRYLDDPVALDTVIDEVVFLGTGGTLAPYLGLHALRRGYDATIYSWNLELFDPTWFEDGTDGAVADGLRAQGRVKVATRLRTATEAYLDFLDAGGSVRFDELSPELLRRHLSTGLPLMAGLSATYIYGSARERFDDGDAAYDPVAGEPTGHFVVIHGLDADTDSVMVADPYLDNPLSDGHRYRVGINRLIGAVMLGVLTYDGNLLVIEPGPDAT